MFFYFVKPVGLEPTRPYGNCLEDSDASNYALWFQIFVLKQFISYALHYGLEPSYGRDPAIKPECNFFTN